MKNYGFTLLEVLLGLGLTAGMLAAVNILLFSTLSGARKAAAVNLVKSEGSYALNAISDLVKYSKSAVCAPGTLAVTRLNGDNVTYSISGNRIASQGAALVSGVVVNHTSMITSDRVRVTACPSPSGLFVCSDDNRAVSICFSVSPASTTDTTDTDTAVFETVAALRNF